MAGEKLSPAELRQSLIIHASDITAKASLDALDEDLSILDLKRIRKELKNARRMFKVASGIHVEPSIEVFPGSSLKEEEEIPTDVTLGSSMQVEPTLVTTEETTEEISETPKQSSKTNALETKKAPWGERAKIVILAALEPNEERTDFKHPTELDIAAAVYGENPKPNQINYTQQTLRGFIHQLTNPGRITVINKTILEKIREIPEFADISKSDLQKLLERQLPFPVLPKSEEPQQQLDLTTEEPKAQRPDSEDLPQIATDSDLDVQTPTPPVNKEHKKIMPVGKRQREIILALGKLNEDGQPLYTHVGDLKMIEVLYPEKITGLSGLALRKRLRSMGGGALVTRNGYVKRLRAIINGASDAPAQKLLDDLRASDSRLNDLTLENAIALLTRKGSDRKKPTQATKPPRKGWSGNSHGVFFAKDTATATQQPTSPDSQTKTVTKVIVLPDVVVPVGIHEPKAGHVRVRRPSKECIAPPKVKKEIVDISNVPLPEIRTQLTTRQEHLVYSLMLIADSKTAYKFPRIESAVPVVYADVLEKVPERRRAQVLNNFIEDSKKTVYDFVELLRDYKPSDPDTGFETDASPVVVKFVDWVLQEPLYENYTIEEIVRVLTRVDSCKDIFEMFQEYEDVNEHARQNGHIRYAADRKPKKTSRAKR